MSKHLLAVLVLCASVFGQISGGSSSGSSGTGIVKYTVATLPATAALRTIVEITDGLSNQDCTSGGGAATVPCMWNGSAWVAMVVQGAASFSTGTAPTACGSATGCVAGTEASTAGTPAAGQSYFRFDSTSHALKGSYNNGAEFIMLPVPGTSGNVLKSDGTNWTSAAASGGATTVTWAIAATADGDNRTSAGAFATTGTLATSGFSGTTSVEINVYGHMTTPGTNPAMVVSVLFGSTAMCVNGAASVDTSDTDIPWELHCHMVVYSPGASAVVRGTGRFQYVSSLPTMPTLGISKYTNTMNITSNQTVSITLAGSTLPATTTVYLDKFSMQVN